jgi:hypothetical protein
MVKRSSLLWVWALMGVPLASGVIGYIGMFPHLTSHDDAYPSVGVPAAVAIILCVISGLCAGLAAASPGAGWVRRSAFAILYVGAMWLVCAFVIGELKMAALDL